MMTEPEKKPKLPWKQRLKAIYDDASKQAKDTVDTLGVLVSENTPKGAEPRNPTLKERMNIAYGKLSKTEWLSVARETAKELRKPDELKRLAGTVIALPGGLAVYGAYRVAKHHKDKQAEAANDNKNPAAPSKKSKPPAPK